MHTLIVLTDPIRRPRTSAWYAAPIASFLDVPDQQVLGALVEAGSFDVTPAQRDAWLQELVVLRPALSGLEGWVILEFDIPQIGSRVDVVVVSGSALIPIEFKVGEQAYHRSDLNQAWDYALDLKNFHAASHDASIFPILLATEAPDNDAGWGPPHEDGVRPPRRCNADGLSRAITEALRESMGPTLDGAEWITAPYRPTPTIIEAAQALYARNAVEAISRNDAGACGFRKLWPHEFRKIWPPEGLR